MMPLHIKLVFFNIWENYPMRSCTLFASASVQPLSLTETNYSLSLQLALHYFYFYLRVPFVSEL